MGRDSRRLLNAKPAAALADDRPRRGLQHEYSIPSALMNFGSGFSWVTVRMYLPVSQASDSTFKETCCDVLRRRER
jgi:hypothetical protein